MADTSDFVNPVSLFPSEGSQDILPGRMHSLQGDAINQDRASAAQQFIRAQLQRLPQETQLKMMETESAIGRQPMEDSKKKEALRQEYAELKGKPVGALIDSAASLWGTPGFKDRNPFQKAQAYGGIVNTWKARHPGLQLPSELENYHPDTTDQHLQDAFNMKRYDTEFQQKKDIELGKEQAQIAAQRGSRAEAAQIAADARRDTAKLAQRDRSDKLRWRHQQQQIINSPSASAQEKQEASANLEDDVAGEIEDKIVKRWGKATDAFTPGQIKRYEEGTAQYRKELRQSYGLEKAGGAAPKAIDETDRVSVLDAKGNEGTVPRTKLDAYLKANPGAKRK